MVSVNQTERYQKTIVANPVSLTTGVNAQETCFLQDGFLSSTQPSVEVIYVLFDFCHYQHL